MTGVVSTTGPALAVAARLRALVVRDDLRAGDRLGCERGLAEDLGVPRAQVRAALDALEADGVVRRVIGRGGGVLVADGRVERHLNTVESLPEIARYQGVRVRTAVLRVELTTAGSRARRRLGLPDGAAVHRIVRLRRADDRPLSIETSHLPADLFPGLARQDLTSLYRTLRAGYGVVPERSDETLQLEAADPDQAELLGVAPGTPLFHVERVATGADGRAIEWAHELFVADRMRFHLHPYGYVKPERDALRPAARRRRPTSSVLPHPVEQPAGRPAPQPAEHCGGRA